MDEHVERRTNEEQPEDPRLDALVASLAPFSARNPEAALEKRRTSVRANRPWDDDALQLRIGPDEAPLVSALNAVRLPPRYIALWHSDTKKLEFIYTVAPVSPHLRARAFEFQFRDRGFRCEYAAPSDRLLLIAEAARFVRAAGTGQHRNLTGFNYYVETRKQTPERVAALTPTCFWIHDVDWDEEQISSLVANLNFYMYYYDRGSPLVMVHESQPESTTQQQRFPFTRFPERISGRRLDDFLLGLWHNSLSAGPRLQFLYLYQIIEYRAYYFMRDGLLRKVRRVLLSPDVQARPDESAKRVIDAVEEARLRDEERLRELILQCVDPIDLWNAIQPNLASFEHETAFDGGFSLPPLITKQSCKQDDFAATFFKLFPDHLRFIRNALVHGREPRGAGVIAPTLANDSRLSPWLDPLTTTAMQVILFHES